MGQQSTYTEEMAEAICARLAEGETLRSICRDDSMPTWRTVYTWIEQHQDFAARIARARVSGHDAIAAECIEIADDSSNDYVPTEHGPALDREHVQRSKIRIDTRLRLLAKWDSGRYGDTGKLEISGPGGAPIQMDATTKAARMSAILAAAQARKDAAGPSKD